jgi:hypothetical protein
VLDELWHNCHLNITEQAAGIILPYVVTAEPRPYLRDIATALLNSSQRGVEIPVGRPISGNVRGDHSYGSKCCFLIWFAARLLQSAVLHQGESSTGNKYVSGLLPANPGVNPVKRGRREHGLKPPAGKQRILKLSVYIFHPSSTFQVLPGQCNEARAGFDCRDVQAPSGKAARQLAASAPDLEHMITAPDSCDPAGLIDEFVRISRTVAVVLSRYLIKDLAVTTCRRFWSPRHALAFVHARHRDPLPDDRTPGLDWTGPTLVASRAACGPGAGPRRTDPPATGTHVRAGSRRRLGLWSNAVVFVRVWEYEVPGDRAVAFTTAYAADGAWGELFGRAAGFLGTELYRDAVRADRFLTIDRWQNEEDWQSFLHAFGAAYESLDAQLEGLAVAERSLFEGSS